MKISTTDIVGLATKCDKLMASDVHTISLFTTDFMNKLKNCIDPFLFKIYLLPYISWFNCSILKKLTDNNKEAVRMIDHFVNSLDYNKHITSYHILEFSQLVIPLDESQYTLLATKHITNINKLVLKDVKDIEVSLIKRLEITEHAIQLVAIHSESCCFYWLIPSQIRQVVETNLCKGQLELCNKGIVSTRLLPVNFYSQGNILQQNENQLFSCDLEYPVQV